MKLNEKALLALKKQIEEAKSELSELRGKKKQLESTLQKEFKCSTIEEAHGLLEQMEEERQALNEKINTKIQQLEEKYDFS